MKNRLLWLWPLLVLSSPLAGLDLAAEVTTKDDHYFLSVRLQDFPGKEVLKAIQEGYRTEVRFYIQVIQRDPKAFLQDKMVMEAAPTFSASWDIFENEYQIEMPDGGLVSFSNDQVFLKVLSQLLFFPLQNLGPPPPGQMLFANLRGEVVPVKLVPPINLLTFFSSEYREITPWKTQEIAGKLHGQ